MAPIAGGTVTFYSLNGDGTIGAELGTAATDSQGAYRLTISPAPSSPIVGELTRGSYQEEGSGTTVVLGDGAALTVVLPLGSLADESSPTAAITPLTHIAATRIRKQLSEGAGGDSETLIRNTTYNVSSAFGLADIVGTTPATPTGLIPADAAGQYTLILAALSQSAKQAGVDSIALTNAQAESFANEGSFVPTMATVADSTGTAVAVTPPDLKSLAQTEIAIQSGTLALAGVSGFFNASINVPSVNTKAGAIAPQTFQPGTPATTSASTVPVTVRSTEFDRTYAFACPAGKRISLNALTWKTLTPGDSNIEFYLVGASTEAGLTGTGYHLATAAKGNANGSMMESIDRYLAAQTPSVASPPFAKLRILINPTSDKKELPELESVSLNSACVDL